MGKKGVRTFQIVFFSLLFSSISTVADGPNIALMPVVINGLPIFPSVHALRIFIAMQVHHCYNSSTDGLIFLTRVLKLFETYARIKILI